MSMRLQVVMSDDEYAEIRETARRHRTTVSEWVRRALRQYRPSLHASVGVSMGRAHRTAYGEEAHTMPPFPGKIPMEIDIDPILLEQVMGRYNISTPRLAVDLALRKASSRPMSKAEVLGMEGFGWEGDLDIMRNTEEPELP